MSVKTHDFTVSEVGIIRKNKKTIMESCYRAAVLFTYTPDYGASGKKRASTYVVQHMVKDPETKRERKTHPVVRNPPLLCLDPGEGNAGNRPREDSPTFALHMAFFRAKGGRKGGSDT